MPTEMVFADNMTGFNATTLNAGFQVCDPGISQSAFRVRVVNTSEVSVRISYNGTYANDVVPAKQSIDIELLGDSSRENQTPNFSRSTPIYVSQVTGPAKGGYIYIINYYQVLN